jgi:hypothetical protein
MSKITRGPLAIAAVSRKFSVGGAATWSVEAADAEARRLHKHGANAQGRNQEEVAMEEQQVGWIAAIIIGGSAGWLAEQFMKSQMGRRLSQGGSEEVVGEVGMRSPPPSGGRRYG